MCREEAREFSELLEGTLEGALKFSTRVESELKRELSVPLLCLFVEAKLDVVAEIGVGVVVEREEFENLLDWYRSSSFLVASRGFMLRLRSRFRPSLFLESVSTAEKLHLGGLVLTWALTWAWAFELELELELEFEVELKVTFEELELESEGLMVK